MKKKIDTSFVESNLRGESVFFPTKENEPAPGSAGEPIENKPQEAIFPQQPFSSTNEIVQSDISHQDANTQSSMHASKLAESERIQTIVKTLRSVGKEVLYVRSTLEEKEQVKEIVHFYEQKRRMKTSDNEIGRIALNYLLEDYKIHGDESILAKVLEKLHV